MKIFLSLLLLPAVVFGAEGNLAKADQLFSKNLYQEALDIYAKEVKLPGEDGLKAVYRAAECEALLFRFGEAAQRLSGIKLPADQLWRGRFLLLRAEAGRRYLAQYGYSLPSDTRQGTKDVTKLTSAQWRGRIEGDYDALWTLRHELLKHRLETQGYFVDVKGAELAYTPTLWDFAVLRWTEYLLGESAGGGKLPEAEKFVAADYRADYSAAAPAAAKAAAIYEDAAGTAPGGMDFAREYWKLKRLLIPFEHGDRTAAADLEKLRDRGLAVLRGWAQSFKSPLARAWAGYQAAQFLSLARDFKGVVAACARAEAEASSSKPAALCSRMRAEIEMPRLELYGAFAPPPGAGTLRVSARNLPSVYFRAYRTTPAELAAMGAGEIRAVTIARVEVRVCR